jgi:hypothetical protein
MVKDVAGSSSYNYNETDELAKILSNALNTYKIRRQLVMEREMKSGQYECARKLTFILAILAGCLDKSVIDQDKLEEALKRDYGLNGINEDTLKRLIEELLKCEDPTIRKLLAVLCCALHWQICNHCACH